MGDFENFERHTLELIDEMEADTDRSRGQTFLEDFWKTREKLQEGRGFSYGEEKNSYGKLLVLLNRKGEENDMEPY